MNDLSHRSAVSVCVLIRIRSKVHGHVCKIRPDAGVDQGNKNRIVIRIAECSSGKPGDF